jgi:pimeloyl-ACP methyl ester carboxylesterase
MTWKRVAERMPNCVDVVLLDSRNHGGSGRGPGGYEYHVADVIAIIESLEAVEPTVVGHSIGAMTALGVGVCRPDVVARVVLLDPPFRDSGISDYDEEKLAFIRMQLITLSTSTPDELLALARRQHPQWDEADYPAWIQSKLQVGVGAADDLINIAWRDVAARCLVPSLLAYGDQGRGGVVSPAVAHAFKQVTRHGAAVQIPDCGHNIHRENFEATVELLSQASR